MGHFLDCTLKKITGKISGRKSQGVLVNIKNQVIRNLAYPEMVFTKKALIRCKRN